MDINDKMVSVLSETIVDSVNKAVENIDYDKSFKAIVTAVLGNNQYKVAFNGAEYNIPAGIKNTTFKINDSVWVMIPQNRWADMYISSSVIPSATVLPTPNTWIATATTMGDSNWGYYLTIPNFVFTEGCQVTFKAPIAPIEGIWIYVSIPNVTTFGIRKLNGEYPTSDSWVANAMVTVTLSSSVVLDYGSGSARGGTAFFKGGAGSIKDMYDFPLSIQTATPTPVNTNHIWIANDTQRILVIDEAVRAGYDNYYCAKTSNTNNKYLNLVTTKKTTDGTKITMFDNYINRDATPWTTANNVAFTNGSTITSLSQFPLIYSKVNGAVDMETAYRWDGSAWQYLSQKGKYVFSGFTGASPYNHMYNRSGNVLIQHSDIIVPYSYPIYSKFSPDGVYLFVSIYSSPYLYAFKRIGDTFTQITFNLHLQNYIFDIQFSHDGNYVALCTYSLATCDIYKKQPDGSWVFLTSLSGQYTYCCAWSQDDSYLSFSGRYNYIYLYKKSGDTFTYLTINVIGTASSSYYKYKMEYDSTGNFIVCTSNTTPYINLLYKTSETTFNVMATTNYGVPSQYTNVKFLPNNYIVLGAGGYLYIYSYTYNTFTYINTIVVGTNVSSLDVNNTGTYLIVGGTNYMYMYSISGATLTLVNTIAISGTGYGCTLLN